MGVSMATCPDRGRDHPVDGKRCAGSTKTATRAAAPPLELESIAYLLNEIPTWRERGWICEHCSELLADEYRCRQSHLLASPQLHPEPAHAPAASGVPNTQANDSDPSSAARGTALSELMESRSMKLLALLAAMFILVGMRQILVWRWAGRLALTLI